MLARRNLGDVWQPDPRQGEWQQNTEETSGDGVKTPARGSRWDRGFKPATLDVFSPAGGRGRDDCGLRQWSQSVRHCRGLQRRQVSHCCLVEFRTERY